MLNRGENRTRDLGVTSPHALPSELHGQPDFKTVNYYLCIFCSDTDLVNGKKYHKYKVL